MKNTTFRKKALLSSVAMLLVAFIALGSATFAWFTANPTVEANGFSAQASTAAGLAVLSASEKVFYGDNEVWDYDTIINCKEDEQVTDDATVLGTPVSYDYTTGGVFYTTTASEEDSYLAENISAATTSTSYYSEQIFFKSTVSGQTATVKSASVSLEVPTGSAAQPMSATVRAMLVDADGNVIGTWNASGTGNKYITAGPVLSSDNFEATVSGKAVSTSLECDFSGEDYVTLYVFIDGEDQACKTTNVQLAKDILSSVNVTLSTLDA